MILLICIDRADTAGCNGNLNSTVILLISIVAEAGPEIVENLNSTVILLISETDNIQSNGKRI